MNINQAIAYAGVTVDFFNKKKEKITPDKFTKKMEIMYELYNEDEIEYQLNEIIENNKMINKKINGIAYCYIINIFDSEEKQSIAMKKFIEGCKLEIGKTYIASPGKNTNQFYELIQDIRNKNMNVLIVTIFSIYAIPDEEWAMIVKLCRENEINIIEI